MCFYNVKRKSLIFIIMLLALLPGNSIPAGALGGRRRFHAGEGKFRPSSVQDTTDTSAGEGAKVNERSSLLSALARGLEGFSGERLQGLPQLPGDIRRKEKSGQEKAIEPDHNPSLAYDGQGNAYLVWERGNELFWAANQSGKWTKTGKLPGEGGNRPIVIAIPQTAKNTASTDQDASAVQEAAVDQNTPLDQDPVVDQNISGDQSEPAHLFCAWESFTAPKKIMGSKGTLAEDGGINWSEPQALTGDSNDDYGIALTLDSGNHPLMLWVQRASFEDDADLYYQVITPGNQPFTDGGQVIASPTSVGEDQATSVMLSAQTGNGDMAIPPAPPITEAGGQVSSPAPQVNASCQDAPPAPAADGRAAPAPSADGVQNPPSNWVGQAPFPISVTGPISPYINATCVSIILINLNINIPSAIPILGETAELEIARLFCGNSGLTPLDPAPYLTPALVNELIAALTVGPHLTLGMNLFNLGEVAISTDTGSAEGFRSAIEETVVTWGGSNSFVYLSNPIPLNICGEQLGTTRLGVVVAAGIAYAYVRFPNNPELPREFVTLITVGTGPQINFNAFQDKFQGFVLLAGGYSFTHTVSAQGYSFSRGPGISLSGALRFGGDWASLIWRFNRDTPLGEPRGFDISSGRFRPWRRFTGKNTPWWADPNSSYFKRISPWLIPAIYGGDAPYPSEKTESLSDPNFVKKPGHLSLSPKPLMVQSRKDRLRKTITRVMADGNTLVHEVLDLVKEPLVGTGAVYEGKTVLGDISGDLYNDGLPSVARNQSGEILAVWAKALAASSLGTRIYAATYTGEGWSSPVEVTPEIDFHQHPALVFDSRGNPLAVWSSSSNDGLDYEQSSVEEIFHAFGKSGLLYSQRIEGKWTLPKPLAKLPGTNEQVALAAGPDEEISAVWVNQSGKGSCVYGSLWNGSQWSEPKVISRTAMAESPAVAYTAQKPSAVWAQDTDGKAETADDWCLYIAGWDGTSWHSRQLSIAGKSSGETNDDTREKPAGLKKIRNLPAVPSGRVRKTGRRRR